MAIFNFKSKFRCSKEGYLWILWTSLGLGRTTANSVYSFIIASVMGALIMKALIIDVQHDYGKSPHMKTTTAVVVRFCDHLSCVLSAFAVGFVPRKRLSSLTRNLPAATTFDVILTSVFFVFMLSIFTADFVVWIEDDSMYYQYAPVYLLQLIIMALETQFAVTVMKVKRQFEKLNKSATLLLLKTGSQIITLQNILPSVDNGYP